MKKSSLFISAILTTFVLVVLAGAVSGYRAYASSETQLPTGQGQVNTQAPVEEVKVDSIQEAAQVTTTSTWLTPQEAAQLAAMYLGRNDLYSVEPSFMYGQDVYKVMFSSGDLVYVSMDGQIFKVEMVSSSAAQNTSEAYGSQSVTYEHEDDDGD